MTSRPAQHLGGLLLLMMLCVTIGDCCFREIAESLKKPKPKIEYRGCYPSEQMEEVSEARKKPMIRLNSKDCNEECKKSSRASGLMGLGRGHCWCGFKSIGDKAPAHNCDVDCPGNPRDACGSLNYVSVYTMI